MVSKLPTIITPKNHNFCIELCFNGVIEVLENKGNLRFINGKKNLGKAGMIINKSHKPPFSKGGSDLGWTPSITMDEGKRLGWFIWL